MPGLTPNEYFAVSPPAVYITTPAEHGEHRVMTSDAMNRGTIR